MIPQVMAQRLIQDTHQRFGHVGGYKTYQLLKNQLNNMYRQVKCTVMQCDLCQKAKGPNQVSRGSMVSHYPQESLHTISLDLMGPLLRGQTGMKYALALLDTFSKYIQLYPIKKGHHEYNTKEDIPTIYPKDWQDEKNSDR